MSLTLPLRFGGYAAGYDHGRPVALVERTKAVAHMPEATAAAIDEAEELEREALALRQWVGRVPEGARRMPA